MSTSLGSSQNTNSIHLKKNPALYFVPAEKPVAVNCPRLGSAEGD